MPHIAVVVVGDLGRSSRMQLHALALAKHGACVDLVGYHGSPVYPEIKQHLQIRVHELRLPRWFQQIPHSKLKYIYAAFFKILVQHIQLFYVLLFKIHRPSKLLVQNPPSAPTLLVGWIVARLHGAQLIIDWHNLGSDVLALRLGQTHLIVRLLGFYERSFGRLANSHFCVSQIMRNRLMEQGGIDNPNVLYDRPPDWFHRWDARERRVHLSEIGRRIDRTAMEQDGVPVIVCPTSWTADENIELLLDGIKQFDEMLCHEGASGDVFSPATVVVLITGKGELKTRYEAKIAELSLTAVQISTAWLSHEDYRDLLACADLGLCLHQSASGVDLPLKVPEMFGAGLPVGVLDYGQVIAECCKKDINCFTFTTSDELAQQLHRALAGFPHDTQLLDRLRQGTAKTPLWQDEWDRVAAVHFDLSQ